MYFQQEPGTESIDDDWGVSEQLLLQPPEPVKAKDKISKKIEAAVVDDISQDAEQQEYDPFVQELDQDAINSMAEARLHGDPRAPAINPSEERVLPTPEELQDPEQYLQYEQRQEKKIYRAYVDAAKEKVAMLEGMIKQGEEEGISEEELEQARQKVKGIEEMSLQLQQDHPDIMGEDYKPAEPQGWLNPPDTPAP